MKKNLLFAVALSILLTLSAKAAVTVEETTDAEYIINSGYSQIMAEDVFVQKTRVNGKPIEPLYEKNQNILVRAWKKLYAYIDPAQELPDNIHHDIKNSPSYSDL